jgi:uncharacterized protein YabE (DUF348 family)
MKDLWRCDQTVDDTIRRAQIRALDHFKCRGRVDQNVSKFNKVPVSIACKVQVKVATENQRAEFPVRTL